MDFVKNYMRAVMQDIGLWHDEKAALADRLHELSQLTWQQIQQAPRHGQGSETIARTSMKVVVPPAITEDTPILFWISPQDLIENVT